MTSINTNSAAQAAQSALRDASTNSSRLVSVLSSGNKIINASDDAAGLAIGTVLQTASSTLRTALASANQANSLLSVADGGLSNVGKILQRMKALSVQSNSGTNTDAERAFLNQEFQALKTQVDSIAGNTKFNTTNLLNGSISGSVGLDVNTNNGSTTANTSGTIFTITATLPTDGQTITVNGATVTFTTDTARLDRVLVGADATATAVNLAAFLNNSQDSRVSPYKFTNTAGALEVSFRGGATAATTFAIAGANGTYSGTAASFTITVSNGTDGLSAGRTSFNGTAVDNLILDTSRGGINTNAIVNNKDFIGKIGGFEGTYTAASTVFLSLRVGNVVYSGSTGAVSNAAAGTNTAVTLTGVNDDGSTAAGSLVITLQGGNGLAVATQADADNFAQRLNTAFSEINFSQNRDVTSYVGGGNIVTGGSITGSLSGSRIDLKLSDFSNTKISNVQVSAPSAGGDNGKISLVINGETFESRADVGNQLAAFSYTVLTSTTNPSNFIAYQNGATITKFGTADQAKSLQDALSVAFGADQGGTGLTFQVGISSTETIDVKLGDVSTKTLGLGTADIGTQAGAVSASTALDKAITQVTGARAAVGALQSRFNFAASTLSSGIQNTDSAADGYLGADISQSSTEFASNQVKVLASISVLAQANQLPQNLLKLLG